MEKQKILITTAIDYCNDVIHIGQAYEKMLADSYARHHRKINGDDDVYFLTGTDEHGTTNEKAAAKKGITTKEHVDVVSKLDQNEIDALTISYNRFIRTTDEDHKNIAADFFQKSLDAGKIYKGTYEGLYCEGCEAYKTLTELNEDGQCPLHTTREIQKYEEENYFFRWSDYSDFLKELISTDRLKVRPEGKKKEMLAFIEQGLQDIPVTRPKFKLPWGITAPNDPDQVIYVWYDALINYYTAGSENDFWNEDTTITHFVGKDIARWHTLLWPAMLESAGYRLPDAVYVHGFMNLNGQKISKSRGNVIRPTDLVEKYGAEAVRYYFLKNGPITEDVDVSIDHLEEVYMGDLANGLGNLVSRTATLLEKAGYETTSTDYSHYPLTESMKERWQHYRVDQVLLEIWEKVRALDKYLDETKPWVLLKEENPLSEKHLPVWQTLVTEIREISVLIEPFLPETAQRIQKQFADTTIHSADGLFPRLEK